MAEDESFVATVVPSAIRGTENQRRACQSYDHPGLDQPQQAGLESDLSDNPSGPGNNEGIEMERECPLCGDEVSENDCKDIKVDMEFENWTCTACGMIFWEKKKSLRHCQGKSA